MVMKSINLHPEHRDMSGWHQIVLLIVDNAQEYYGMGARATHRFARDSTSLRYAPRVQRLTEKNLAEVPQRS